MGRAHEVRAASMAKTAATKSKLYAKWAREIFLAAKAGVPDPEMNSALKRVIERAKKENVTADVIKRSVDKAKGGQGDNYKEVYYEGFGPGSTKLIVYTLTDNEMRTYTDVGTCFKKSGEKLGMNGSVMHTFEHKSIVSTSDLTEDEVFEAVLNAGLDGEIEAEDDRVYVYGEPKDNTAIREALEAYKEGISVEDEVTYLSTDDVELTDAEDIRKFEKLIGLLEDLDDVQEVYHNAKYEKTEEE